MDSYRVAAVALASGLRADVLLTALFTSTVRLARNGTSSRSAKPGPVPTLEALPVPIKYSSEGSMVNAR